MDILITLLKRFLIKSSCIGDAVSMPLSAASHSKEFWVYSILPWHHNINLYIHDVFHCIISAKLHSSTAAVGFSIMIIVWFTTLDSILHL